MKILLGCCVICLQTNNCSKAGSLGAIEVLMKVLDNHLQSVPVCENVSEALYNPVRDDDNCRRAVTIGA